ncbi:MAG: UvrD-helicase domain-containing protein [Saprospiraceae bacterium]|nr:UvrD-helicase domain-containing protein [Saprospiraceae bacterium]
MSSYLDQLNAVQRGAVTTVEGPVLVIAGPGSGKTRVLTFRIAHLIEQGIAPWEILALTFTNKAAREMKDRIEKVVGTRAQKVWAGTFHSIFARILRGEADKIGYPSNFTIYDTDDSKSLLRNIIKELNLSKDQYNENAILTRISSAKSNLISPLAYEQNAELMAQDKQTKRPFLHRIYSEYVSRCKRAGAMDFDDLLFQLYVLLHQNPDIADKYRQRFRYLLVDEFQDTNYLQYCIVKKLVVYPNSPQNICVVGDDAQSIYAFRGATIDNILDFKKDFPLLQTFKLEQNYRSTQHIVEAANHVISYNRRQIQKNIWTSKTDGQKIKVVKTQSDQEEAKRIADLIQEQKNRYHFRNADFAVLYRTNAQSRPFEEAMRRLNLPYRVYGNMSFYARKEVKDVLAYLRLIVNQNDDEALRRIINTPRRGIGDATLEKIALLAASKSQTLWQTLPEYQGTAREKNALQNFIAMMKAFITKSLKSNAYEIASYVLKQSTMMDNLKQDTSLEGTGRLENVNALLDAISSFSEEDELTDDIIMPDKSLSTYLQNIALVTDADNSDPNADVVTLMSVHSAKGLEYKSVILSGLEEDLFPSFMSKDTPEGLDEERRLFYVAITRAEEFLTLTYAANRYRHGQMKQCDPSRFLNEIPMESTDSLGGLAPIRRESSAPQTSRVSGNFSRAVTPQTVINPSDFKAAKPEDIEIGHKVLHMKFGEGKVIAIEGAKDNRVATIHFKDLTDQPQRKIMLKFAKLQIQG